MRKRFAGFVVAALATGSMGSIAATPAQQAQAAVTGCSVTYTARSWPGGFTTDVKLTNHGPAVDGWALAWDYPNQRVQNAWTAVVTQDGTRVTARNAAWNSRIERDGSVTFGLLGSWTGTNPDPVTFTLNGSPCTGPTEPQSYVDNPYIGVKGYVNPQWKANAESVPGGSRVSDTPTGIWIDRVSKVPGLRGHLDAALAQGAGYVQVVLNNIPGRDCELPFSTGDFALGELARYKAEFIDPVAAILGDPKYAKLRIVTVVELNAVPNLILGTFTYQCDEAGRTGVYQDALRYALSKLHPYPNVYAYLSAAHHGWIGWDDPFAASVALFTSIAAGATGGVNSVDGFITNAADYSPLDEPHFDITTSVGGQSVRMSRWVDWNSHVDEGTFAQALRARLIAAGFSSAIGMLIDTSRNGWGGPNRPAAPSLSTNVQTFVDQSRIDRRYHILNWCNQAGAGLGRRPVPAPAPGIDAYVWMKPPGESDGSSDPLRPDSENRAMQPMCDPMYGGSPRTYYSRSGAMPLAPPAGEWFPAAFTELMANAYPALP